MNPRVIGLLPARGGSKGILRKNLQNFGTGNLLSHKIDQARSASLTDIYVSTEDSEIKEEAISRGAKVIDRPVEFATDTSSTDDVVTHAQGVLNIKSQDVLVLLQVTSPLLLVDSIKSCIKKLVLNDHLQCVFTVHYAHPFLWKSSSNKGDVWEPKNHSRSYRPRRQDLEIEGWETGGCYAIRGDGLLNQRIRYPEPTSTIPVSYLEALDIDTVDDLETARSIFKVYSKMQ